MGRGRRSSRTRTRSPPPWASGPAWRCSGPGTATSSERSDGRPSPPREHPTAIDEGLSWRLIVDEPRRGSRNMALDHALATAVPAGEGVLRLYGWERPTISFGRNEPAAGRYDLEAAEASGIGFVRRPTGGRAVLHHREITYAVALQLAEVGGLKRAYVAVNRALVAGLSRLGVDARVDDGEPVPGLDAGPCFQGPAPGEVTAAGAKLVGSAQARVGDALLQHGSILIEGEQLDLYRLSGGPAEGPSPTTLRGLGVTAEREEMVRELAAGMRLALGGAWAEGDYRAPELDEADRLEWGRYASTDWTWRR